MEYSASFNKNRFLKLNIGLIIACSAVLLAFQWRIEPYTSLDLDDTTSDHTTEIQVISTRYERPKPKKEIKKTVVKDVDVRTAVKLKLTDLKIERKIVRSLPKIDLSAKENGHRALPYPNAGKEEKAVVADVKPQFPGGAQALKKFLELNLNYPEPDLDGGHTGVVVVYFEVAKDGSIRSAKVVKNELSPHAAGEALRIIGIMPKWKPGLIKGKAVRSGFYQSFRFELF